MRVPEVEPAEHSQPRTAVRMLWAGRNPKEGGSHLLSCTIPDGFGFLGSSVIKNPPANAGDLRDTGLISGLVRSPGGGNGRPFLRDFLPGKNPWTEEPGGLWSMGLHRD